MHNQSLSIFGQFTGCFLSLIEVTIKNLILKWRTNCKIYLKNIDHDHYLSLLKFKQSFVILPRNIHKEKKCTFFHKHRVLQECADKIFILYFQMRLPVPILYHGINNKFFKTFLKTAGLSKKLLNVVAAKKL